MQKKQYGRSSVIILLLLRVGYLDVEVIGSQDQLKEGSLVHLRKKESVCARRRRCQTSPNLKKIIIIIIFINLEEVGIPRGDVIGPLFLVLIVFREWGIVLRKCDM